jgi:hypothetical protein
MQGGISGGGTGAGNTDAGNKMRKALCGGGMAALCVMFGVAVGQQAEVHASQATPQSTVNELSLQKDMALAYGAHEDTFKSDGVTYGVRKSEHYGQWDACAVGAVKASGFDVGGKANSFAANVSTWLEVPCMK